MNALRGNYRPGDRIEVGDVFGDVSRPKRGTAEDLRFGLAYASGYNAMDEPESLVLTTR